MNRFVKASTANGYAGQSVHIKAPQTAPVPIDTVIKLQLVGPLEVDNVTIGEINGGGIALQAARAILHGAQLETPYEGSTKLPFQIGGWSVDHARAEWPISVSQAGLREVTISYAATVESSGQGYEVAIDGNLRLSAKVQPTQLNWSEFRPMTVGQIDFPKAGAYALAVRPSAEVPMELFKLLWVYLSVVQDAGSVGTQSIEPGEYT